MIGGIRYEGSMIHLPSAAGLGVTGLTVMKLVAAKVPVSTVWTSPDAPRDIDAPAVAAEPDVAAWAQVDGHRDPTRSARPDPDPIAVRRAGARAFRTRRLVRDRRAVAAVLGTTTSATRAGSRRAISVSCRRAPPRRSRSPSRPPSCSPSRARGISRDLSFGTVLASVEQADGYTRVATARRRIGLARGRRTALGRLPLRTG